MHKLLACSKTLYDHDMENKIKKIKELENKIKELENKISPKVYFNTVEEYNDFVNSKLEDYKDTIKYVIEDDYEWMDTFGIAPRHSPMLYESIEDLLLSFTNNKEWSEEKANIIFGGVDEFIKSLLHEDLWGIIFENTDKEKMTNLLYNNIVNQLFNGSSISIMDDILIVKENV